MNKQKKIISIARQTLRIESQTVRALEAGLDDVFVECVLRLFRSKGRLVITGIGKTAIVAQKMVATFNSTGTPAVFMHAADAIHGDLGILLPEDILLCISKSGETSELKVLIPLVRKFGNTIVAITAAKDSFLAKQADFCLHTPVTREADPNNLAPTASTTAQMVMGDILATVLLDLRGFSSNDFALFHPGGALGKQLYLRVDILAAQNEAPKVFVHSSLQDCIVEMSAKRLGAVVVLDVEHRLAGIITDGDLRRILQKQVDILQLCAKEVMNPHPKTIVHNELAINALALMRKHSITQLVVLDDEGYYVGMVHLHDLLREGIV